MGGQLRLSRESSLLSCPRPPLLFAYLEDVLGPPSGGILQVVGSVYLVFESPGVSVEPVSSSRSR